MPKDLKIFNDSYFREWIKTLKQIIKQSQLKAAIHVNSELLQLYWDIGKEIVQRDIEAKWGSKIFATMSSELKDAFPGMEGFSVTNLKIYEAFFFSFIRMIMKLVNSLLTNLKNYIQFPGAIKYC